MIKNSRKLLNFFTIFLACFRTNENGFQINGHVTIFNQGFDRPGSERDVENLKETFKKRGVKATVKLNLKHDEIVRTINSCKRKHLKIINGISTLTDK